MGVNFKSLKITVYSVVIIKVKTNETKHDIYWPKSSKRQKNLIVIVKVQPNKPWKENPILTKQIVVIKTSTYIAVEIKNILITDKVKRHLFTS